MSDAEDDIDYGITSIHPTNDQRVLYVLTAIITVSVPIYLYQTIFDMPLEDFFFVFGVVTLGSAFILTFAYHNVAYSLKGRLSAARENLFSHSKVASEAPKGEKKKEFVKKRREQQEDFTTKESIAFSILYNNVFFLLSTVVLAFYVFSSASAPYNYVLSVSLSSALLSFVSASQV